MTTIGLSHPLVNGLDLIGTLVFAMSGAARGVREKMDAFGVIVLAYVTAVSGGIVRDVMIGAIPPESVSSWHNLALALAGGLFVFSFSRFFERLIHPVMFFDAIGLGVFAVAGTQKALDYAINWPMAAILGMVSGIGGGMVRDILTARTPIVLKADLYAMAALAGAMTVILGSALGIAQPIAVWSGVAICVLLRMMAIYRGWHLPVAARRET